MNRKSRRYLYVCKYNVTQAVTSSSSPLDLQSQGLSLDASKHLPILNKWMSGGGVDGIQSYSYRCDLKQSPSTCEANSVTGVLRVACQRVNLTNDKL